MQAGDNAGPDARLQDQHRFSQTEMVVTVRQTAFVLDRQVVVLEPVAVVHHAAAAHPQPQGEIRGMHPPRRGIGRLQHRLELVHLGFDVMVAAVHQQANLQFQVTGGALRRQSVGDVAGVGARLQPDALLQYEIADREPPNRHPPLQMERFEMNVAAGVDHVDTGPTIAEQRNFPVPVHQGGVGLGEYQPAAERRPYRRHQQTVITPGQGTGHGAGGVATQTVRQPPLAPFGLRQIAAQRPAAANETRDVIVHGITRRLAKITTFRNHFPARHRKNHPLSSSAHSKRKRSPTRMPRRAASPALISRI